MKNAMSLTGVGLSFSTIQKGDTFDPLDSGKGGAEGAVGILADVAPITQVLRVHPSDMGSLVMGGTASGLGVAPSPQACADSIDRRQRSNEWLVQDYNVVGIFILQPLLVRIPVPGTVPVIYAESLTTIDDVVDVCFPQHRVFSVNHGSFIEFDRASLSWVAVAIRDIYA